MIILDGTITTVALPAIQRDLGFSQASLAWVVNSYLIAFGGLLLLAGRLGDLFGRRRVLLTGLAVFTLASLLCGLASSPEVLVAARFLQGAGAAVVPAVSLSMIVMLFQDARERGNAIGVYSCVASAGASVGLLAGGVLTQALSWHWIFFVNLPIGVVTIALSLRLLRPDTASRPRVGADVLGAALVTSGLMLGVVAIVGTAEHGWTSARTLVLGAVAVALLVGFAVRQLTAATPLLPPRVLRPRNVWGANVVLLFAYASMGGMFFISALLLQRVYGYDPLETGIAFLPTSLSMASFSLLVSPRVARRFGARAAVVAGVACVVASLALLARAPLDPSYALDLFPGLLLAGVGGGLTFPAIMTLAMSAALPADAGIASGVLNTTQQVGGAVGLAILATIASTRTGTSETVAALADGYSLAFSVAAGMAAFALALALLFLRSRSRESAGVGIVPERAEPVRNAA
jgi:EmrB/QacA subfamily drug resistance transporter